MTETESNNIVRCLGYERNHSEVKQFVEQKRWTTVEIALQTGARKPRKVNHCFFCSFLNSISWHPIQTECNKLTWLRICVPSACGSFDSANLVCVKQQQQQLRARMNETTASLGTMFISIYVSTRLINNCVEEQARL